MNNILAIIALFVNISIYSNSFTNSTDSINTTINFQLDSVIEYKFGELNDSIFSGKRYCLYDVNNNEEVYIDFNFTMSKWEEEEKSIYKYNLKGNLIEELDYNWDITKNDWKGDTKSLKYYNSMNKVDSTIEFIWNITLNNWLFDKKYEHKYDSKNQLNTINYYSWVQMASIWKCNYKYEFNNDSMPNSNFRILKKLNNNNNWINESKEKYNYDNLGNVISQVNYIWNSKNNLWEETLMYEYQFKNNIITTMKYLMYNKTNLSWSNSSKIEYLYDINSNLNLTKQYKWDITSSDWLLYLKSYRYFSEKFNSDIISSGNTNKSLIIYPNPTNDFLNININATSDVDVNIYNLKGQLVWRKSIKNDSKEINIRHLESGPYYIQFIYNNQSVTKKIVKL